jgi:hypothetical protein
METGQKESQRQDVCEWAALICCCLTALGVLLMFAGGIALVVLPVEETAETAPAIGGAMIAVSLALVVSIICVAFLYWGCQPWFNK